MKSATLSLLKIPRAYTVAEVGELLDLHERTVQRLIQRGILRGFEHRSYPHPPGCPHAFRRVRLYVSSRELERYLDERTEEYAATLARRQPSAKVRPDARARPQ